MIKSDIDIRTGGVTITRPLCFLLCKPLVSFISMIYLLIPYNIRIYHLPQKDDIRRNASEIVIKADSVITIADKIF